MKRTVTEHITLILVGCLLFCCIACVGCDTKKAEEPDNAQTETVESIITIGERSSTAANMVLTNELGAEIADIAVVPSGSSSDPVFSMANEKTIGNGEQVDVYVEPTDDQTLFDVIILVGENRYTLHNVNFVDWEEATIRVDGDVAYLEIMLNGEPVSTLREEYDIAHPIVEVPQNNVSGTGYYSGSGYDSGSVATVDQGEDRCVSDVVLR